MSNPMGQQNVSGAVQVLGLSESSLRQQQQHEAVVLDLQAKEMAAKIDVPTLPAEVQAALRQFGLPIRLFGENLANVRDRLRMELARRQVLGDRQLERIKEERIKREEEEEEEQVTKYTNASQALIQARQDIAKFSLERAKLRLDRERKLRILARTKRKHEDSEKPPANNTKLDELLDPKVYLETVKSLKSVALAGSQYGDSRSLSCLVTMNLGQPLVATASWTGSVQLWDAETLQSVGRKTCCHEDRIMGMAATQSSPETALLCTASIDLTAKLFQVKKSDVVMEYDDDDEDGNNEEKEESAFTITETAHLKGHAARLCRTAFHPMQRHVATTSFDHTWRLWDIETGQNILLQDGHARECFGIGFHGDGSLCATTDFAGVVQLWDLRTGKSIHHFLGHAKRVLNAEFHPNGFQLATAGDDGTIRIWDLRRRKLAAAVPAHSNLVTQLTFAESGEYLASSSFDGMAKLWSCRDWNMLNQLQGHEGKVTGVDLLPPERDSAPRIATCGFDKTLKLWH